MQYELVEYPCDNSRNYTDRAEKYPLEMIVIHTTVCDLQAALKLLSGQVENNPVSAHYLVSDEVSDVPKVYELLNPFMQIAHHAGESRWQDKAVKLSETSSLGVNAKGVGIEIVNIVTTKPFLGREDVGYEIMDALKPFQLPIVAQLINNFMQQAKKTIHPTCIVPHIAIAPHRKNDPGNIFDWEALHREYKIGAWYDNEQVKDYQAQLESENFLLFENVRENKTMITWAQKNLSAYGYGYLNTEGELDKATKQVIRAFLMQFRPGKFPGRVDEFTYTVPRKKKDGSSSQYWESNEFMNSLEDNLDINFFVILDNLVNKYKPNIVPSLQACLDSQTPRLAMS